MEHGETAGGQCGKDVVGDREDVVTVDAGFADDALTTENAGQEVGEATAPFKGTVRKAGLGSADENDDTIRVRAG